MLVCNIEQLEMLRTCLNLFDIIIGTFAFYIINQSSSVRSDNKICPHISF